VRLPTRIDTLMTRIDEGNVSVQTPRIDRRLTGLERIGRRIIATIIFAALLVGGILLRAEDIVFGTVLMVGSVIPLLYVIFASLAARRGPLP
jgi:hypothetical protein